MENVRKVERIGAWALSLHPVASGPRRDDRLPAPPLARTIHEAGLAFLMNSPKSVVSHAFELLLRAIRRGS